MVQFFKPGKNLAKIQPKRPADNYQTKFTFSYSDPGQYSSATNSLISLQLKDIKLTLNGSVYVNAKNKAIRSPILKSNTPSAAAIPVLATGFEYGCKIKFIFQCRDTRF